MAVQNCSGLKPGESLWGRSNKLANVGHGAVYNQSKITNSPYSTLKTMEQSQVTPGHYKIPDRRGVAAGSDKRDAKKSKPFIATTTSSNSFVDYKAQLRKLKNSNPTNFKQAFDKLDANGSGFIENNELKAFFEEAVGQQYVPGKEIVGKFMKFFDSNQDGKISWADFEASFSTVIDLCENDCNTGSGRMAQPGWMKDKKQQLKIIKPKTGNSSYQVDQGKYGEDPMSRSFMKKTGMQGTTSDLFLGTSKDTYHIPGAAVFIPSAKTNPHAMSQGDGYNTKPRGSDLRLTHNHNLPGYTGHRPVDLKNDYGPRNTGMDCRTSSGAAQNGL